MLWEGSQSKRLSKTRQRESDNYYTLMPTIEEEFQYISPEVFYGKIVYCPADSAESNFFKFFRQNFERFKLKKLICSCYNPDGFGKYTEMTSPAVAVWKDFLMGHGDCLGPETAPLFNQADIIVTNPPFSLARKYFEKVLRSGKQFLLLGSFFIATYVKIFPFLAANKFKIHVGKESKWLFRMADHYEMSEDDKREAKRHGLDFNVGRVSQCCWLLNLPSFRPPCPLELKTKAENEAEGVVYQNYVNYPAAIEVARTKQIPSDYTGLMGVPISFLQWMDESRFELVTGTNLIMRNTSQGSSKLYTADGKCIGKKHISNMFLPVGDDWNKPYYTVPMYEGKCRQAFNRLFIRNKL